MLVTLWLQSEASKQLWGLVPKNLDSHVTSHVEDGRCSLNKAAWFPSPLKTKKMMPDFFLNSFWPFCFRLFMHLIDQLQIFQSHFETSRFTSFISQLFLARLSKVAELLLINLLKIKSSWFWINSLS